MALQMTGKVEKIGATTPISTKNGTTFYKRELVLDCTRFNQETGEPYPNFPTFEFGGMKVNQLDNIKVGQRVTVSFSLQGVKYEDKTTHEVKYFTRVSGWNVEPAEQQQHQQQAAPFPASAPTGQQPYSPQQEQQPFPPAVDQDGNPVENPDDLPF